MQWTAHAGFRSSRIRCYALAVAIFAAALALRLLLLPVESRLAFITFYPATIFAFYLCGAGPGLVVLALSTAAGAYVFTPPTWSWVLTREAAISITAFVLTGLLIGWAMLRLKATRDELASTLAELRTSEHRYRAILEDQTDAIARFLLDGTMLYVNEAYCRMFGVRRDAIVGRSWQPVAHPDDVAGIHEKLATLSPERPVVVVENRVFGADGGVRWAQFVNRAFFDASGGIVEIQSVGRDVTDRKALETELRDTGERLRDLYDNAPCGYYSVDPNGTIVAANAVMLALLGCRGDDVLGKRRLLDFLAPESRERFDRLFAEFKAHGRITPTEYDLVGRDGTERRVSVSATAIRDDAGEFVQSRSVMYDITELHQARSELGRINRVQSAMLDNDLVGIVRLRERRAVWHNRAFERIFGYAPGELVGMPSRLLYFDDASYRAAGEAAYPILHAGGHFRTQLRLRRKGGEAIWVDISGMPLSETDDESMWLMTDITSIKEYEARIEAMAFHDALTGLPNRALLADRLQQGLSTCARLGGVLAICYVDLDRFKTVNDDFGHEAGDRVLVVMAKRLQHQVRAIDTVGRIGGDEFVMLLALDSPDECGPILDRVLASLAEPVPLPNGLSVTLSASIGVAVHPRDGSDADALVGLADAAMYAAKAAGRNRICVQATAPAERTRAGG